MTRREFLKHMKNYLAGVAVLYFGRLFNMFHARQDPSSKATHPAKYCRQADDLAG